MNQNMTEEEKRKASEEYAELLKKHHPEEAARTAKIKDADNLVDNFLYRQRLAKKAKEKVRSEENQSGFFAGIRERFTEMHINHAHRKAAKTTAKVLAKEEHEGRKRAYKALKAGKRFADLKNVDLPLTLKEKEAKGPFDFHYWGLIAFYTFLIVTGVSGIFALSISPTVAGELTGQQKRHNSVYATMPGSEQINIFKNRSKFTEGGVSNSKQRIKALKEDPLTGLSNASSTMTLYADLMYRDNIEKPNKVVSPGHLFGFLFSGASVLAGCLLFYYRFPDKKENDEELS